jgi:hypothetical protein
MGLFFAAMYWHGSLGITGDNVIFFYISYFQARSSTWLAMLVWLHV